MAKLLKEFYDQKIWDCGDFILKENWNGAPPKRHILAPFFLFPVYRKRGITIQHKAGRRNAIMACNLIRDALKMERWNKEIYNDTYDLRPANCGWFLGKPICFDCVP